MVSAVQELRHVTPIGKRVGKHKAQTTGEQKLAPTWNPDADGGWGAGGGMRYTNTHVCVRLSHTGDAKRSRDLGESQRRATENGARTQPVHAESTKEHIFVFPFFTN